MRQIWGEPGLLQQSVLSPLDEAKSMLAKKLLIGSRGVGLGPEREPQLGPTHNPISHRTTVATWPLLGAGYYPHFAGQPPHGLDSTKPTAPGKPTFALDFCAS